MNVVAEYIRTYGRGARKRLAIHMGVSMTSVARWNEGDNVSALRKARLAEFLLEEKALMASELRAKKAAVGKK